MKTSAPRRPPGNPPGGEFGTIPMGPFIGWHTGRDGCRASPATLSARLAGMAIGRDAAREGPEAPPRDDGSGGKGKGDAGRDYSETHRIP